MKFHRSKKRQYFVKLKFRTMWEISNRNEGINLSLRLKNGSKIETIKIVKSNSISRRIRQKRNKGELKIHRFIKNKETFRQKIQMKLNVNISFDIMKIVETMSNMGSYQITSIR